MQWARELNKNEKSITFLDSLRTKQLCNSLFLFILFYFILFYFILFVSIQILTTIKLNFCHKNVLKQIYKLELNRKLFSTKRHQAIITNYNDRNLLLHSFFLIQWITNFSSSNRHNRIILLKKNKLEKNKIFLSFYLFFSIKSGN